MTEHPDEPFCGWCGRRKFSRYFGGYDPCDNPKCPMVQWQREKAKEIA